MRVVMIGAGRNPSSFIARQIESVRATGKAQVTTFSEPSTHRFIAAKLSDRGFIFHLPRRELQLVKCADLVHYQWPSHLARYHHLARRFDKPVVLSLRGRQVNILPHVPGNARYAERLRSIMRLPDAYHCVSEDILEEARQYGLDPQRARVIRPAVDTSFFAPPSERPHSPPLRIVMVGELVWRKGYEFALLALKRLADLGVDFEASIAGDGDEVDRVRYTIHDLQLEHRVRPLGRLSPDGVRQLLRDGHVFLLCSSSEGIANVAIEAMACGLPVVVTDAGGMREAVSDGIEGFVVPVWDVDLMAERLKRLADDPRLRTRLGTGARRRAERDFDWEGQALSFIDLYESVLHR